MKFTSAPSTSEASSTESVFFVLLWKRSTVIRELQRVLAAPRAHGAGQPDLRLVHIV